MSGVAVVTGASSGIGAATAVRLAEAGYHVVAAARRSDRVEALAEQIRGKGGRAEARTLDVTDRAAVDALAASLDRCDVLVANAGGAMGGDQIADGSADDWRAMYEVNVLGVLHVTQALLPALRATGDGAIVTFSGGGATAPLPRVHAYAASKAGIVRLTENLAAELAEDGITINAIGPGFVATSIHDVVLAAGPERAGPLLPRTERQLAEGGVPTQASAELAVFLLSSDARAISGKLISAEWDDWRDAEFRARLAADPDLATLRRIDDQLYRRVQ